MYIIITFIARKIVIHQSGTLLNNTVPGWCITILLAMNVTDSQLRTQSLKSYIIICFVFICFHSVGCTYNNNNIH